MEIDKLFILATWKFESIAEIIENKNFILDNNIYKVALFLKKQLISENDLLIVLRLKIYKKKLPKKNWRTIC